MRFTSSSEKDPSSATFDEVTKSTRDINTMSRVVKRKIQKIKPVVEYNKSGIPHGKAAIEMQSYIGVLARTCWLRKSHGLVLLAEGMCINMWRPSFGCGAVVRERASTVYRASRW
ncbi:unnamed protein product [Prunus armeniaca]